MEQLQCLLFETLRPLVTSSAGRFVELGQTAGQLMTIVEKMHESGYLIVDIKPDNFMVASTLGTGVVTDASLAASVRLIDLGLAMSFKGSANERTGGLMGNALYASLNVHESETPSRRDDVQSILFLIANMVLTVQAIDLGKAPLYGKGDRASHLPWSQENSDEGVGAAKRALVLNEDSDFYQQMPSEAAKILFDCIVESSSLSYKQTPSYEDLRQALSTLKVPRTSNLKPAPRGSKTAEAVKPAPTRKSPRMTARRSASTHDANDDVDDPQDVQSKRSSKAARTRPLYDDDDDDVVMEEETVSDEEEENEASIMADVDLSVTGFGLFCQDKDLWIILSNDCPKVVVGKRPSCKEGSLIRLDDPSLEPSHVMLKLGSIPGSVVVKPLNEKAIVLLENGPVPVSGTCAFKGQTIEFGDFSFKVRVLPIQSFPVKKVATTHHGLTKSPQKPRAQPRSHHHELAKSPQKPRAQPRRRRALLEIVTGSLKGNKYELIPDNRDVIIVGSDPSGNGFLVTLDEVGVTENHVRFELSHNKVSGTTVTMHVLMAPFDLEVNGETLMDADIICIADDSVIKLSDDAHVAVTFTKDN
jgi:serine/threonine protein kinase